ncbi:hypothetical protein ACWFRT_04945 [Streptomyces anulatus]
MQTVLADFSGISTEEEPETERGWEFGHPFVKYDDGLDTLSDKTREQLDRRESGFTSEEREKTVAALRVLVTAHAQVGGWASLDDPSCRLFAESDDSDGFYPDDRSTRTRRRRGVVGDRSLADVRGREATTTQDPGRHGGRDVGVMGWERPSCTRRADSSAEVDTL